MILKRICFVLYIVLLDGLFLLLFREYLNSNLNGIERFVMGFITGYLILTSALKIFKLK